MGYTPRVQPYQCYYSSSHCELASTVATKKGCFVLPWTHQATGIRPLHHSVPEHHNGNLDYNIRQVNVALVKGGDINVIKRNITGSRLLRGSFAIIFTICLSLTLPLLLLGKLQQL